MKYLFNILLAISFFLTASLLQVNAQTASWLKLKQPPESLAQWYKPENKRQVWLHTMFKLRREMQAIGEYAQQSNTAAMQKWIDRLDKDYNKISTMVPEWEIDVKPRLIEELQMFADDKDFVRLAKTLDMIKDTCDNCHNDYKPLVTLMYRTPDYEDIEINISKGKSVSFEENMTALSQSVNRILIALDDKNNEIALQSSHELMAQLEDLGKTCSQCHKDDSYPRQRILGDALMRNMKLLQSKVTAGHVKDSQKLVGEIAVSVCSRCHNIHRVVNDVRETLLH